VLSVSVVEASGDIVSTTGSVVVICDAKTGVAVALVRMVGDHQQFLTCRDGAIFDSAVKDSLFSFQLPSTVRDLR